MGGLTSPKGGETKTTTQVNSVPSYVSSAQQNLYQSGQNITAPFLQAPNYTTAGVNADMSGAYDLTRYLAQSAFTQPAANVPTPSSAAYTPNISPAANVYAYGATAPGSTYAPSWIANRTATMNASQVSGADVQALMNPYIQSVIDPAKAQLRQQHDATSAQIGAQSAAAGSYGGSREAIRQAQNDRSLGEQTSSLVGQLMSQGYSQAQALAQANAQMRQQADSANMAAQNQFTAADAAAANTAGQFNANATDTTNRFNAQNWMGVNAANANAQNSRDQFLASLGLQANNQNFSQGLSAAQLQDTLAGSDQTRKLQAIQALLGIGGQQQQLAQSNLNVPLQYLQALAALTPQNTGGTQTTTAPNTAQSPLQTLLGIGTSLGGAALRGAL
jgi:hypothetical protein